MAFPSAPGYNQLQGGVWSPTIYSKTVQKQFRRKAVAKALCNNDYFGEIANFGDSVVIIKEPEINVSDYARGTQLTPQDLTDESFTLIIDKAKSFNFIVDDIEKKMSHVNWESMASDRAAYKLADSYDKNMFAYMTGYDYDDDAGTYTARTSLSAGTAAESTAGSDELLSANKLARNSFVSGGSSSDSVAVGVSGTYDVTPLAVLNRINRLMDVQNVDKDGRWVVLDPVYIEILMDENSKFMNHDYQMSEGLDNGKIASNKIRGFDIYSSNNLPQFGTGAGTGDNNGSSANYGFIVAGQKSAVATAEKINKTESFRSPNTFGDVVRGLHMYGRKILRPQALFRVAYNINA